MTEISLRDLGYQPVQAGLRGKEEHDEKKPRRKLGWDERRDSVAECSLITKLFRHDAAGDAPEPSRIHEHDDDRRSWRDRDERDRGWRDRSDDEDRRSRRGRDYDDRD